MKIPADAAVALLAMMVPLVKVAAGWKVTVLVELIPITSVKLIGKVSVAWVYPKSIKLKITGPATPLNLRSLVAAVMVS